MPTKASTVYGSSSGGVRPNGLQGFSFDLAGGLLTGLGVGSASGINISTGLVTVLSLSGRFSIAYLALLNVAIGANNLRIVLEIDGVTVVDSTQAASTLNSVQVINYYQPITCQSSLVLKAQKPTATSVSVQYQAISLL